jgi:hypothetical protein
LPEFNLIQRPDLILRLQQFTGLRQAHVTPALAETIQPVIIAGDIRDEKIPRPTTLQFWNSASAGAGGAGLFARVQLRNPAGSNTLITVREMRLQGGGGAAHTFDMILFASALDLAVASLTAGQLRAGRLGIDPLAIRPKGIVSADGNVAAAPINTVYRVKHPLDGEARIDDIAIVIPAGAALLVQLAEANISLSGSFAWDEEDVETTLT